MSKEKQEKTISPELQKEINENLLVVKDLRQWFDIPAGFKKVVCKAVDGVSFSIKPGETLGLVGESGCGKTTTGRTILNLYEPTSGEIYYRGNLIKSPSSIREMRKSATMVFQDPYSSLDPRMTVGDIIGEPLDIHHTFDHIKNKKERKLARTEKIKELMDLVGLNTEHANRYPHEFSGGQRQRIGIARALATNPDFIICDEPVSALDVSIQAQVVNMFEELKHKLKLSYLFIAHDLMVVRHVSDRIAVMYLGKVMEIGDSDTICDNPVHPYSISLLSAVPLPDPDEAKKRKRIILQGDIPSPINKPSGCVFRTRCRYATEECAHCEPELKEITPGHFAACINLDKVKNN